MTVVLPRKSHFALLLFGVVLSIVSLGGGVAHAAEHDRIAPESEISALDLHQLMSLEVTSSSKKERKLAEVSAAVFVITREDIRRSGVTSIPEALRMAPGLLVSRVDSNKWAISSRSFNSLYANKLLVLIDGRSVFNTLYSAVLWTSQDTLLEDVDRIEVIRGPAAALWGSHAVNGVINIITRSAQLTPGVLMSAGAGSEERGFVNWRIGKNSSANRAWRVFGKHFLRDNYRTVADSDSHDEWSMHRTGFRYDQRIDDQSVTLQGDLFKGRAGIVGESTPPAIVADNTLIAGGNLLLHWQRKDLAGHATKLRLYYDYESRKDFLLEESRGVYDLDFQHDFSLGANTILWGGGYRSTSSHAHGSPKYSLSSVGRRENIYNVFAQNELSLLDRRFLATLGVKLERNPYTHWEAQPNLRLLIVPNERHSLWGAVSRVARTPGRLERESRLAVNGLGILYGNPDFDAEQVTAYELGYRSSPTEDFSFDAALFYNKYNHLRSFEIVGGTAPTMVGSIENNVSGETWGAELAVNWRLSDRLKTLFSATYIQVDFKHRDPNASALVRSFAQDEEEKTPSYHAYLRIDYDPTENTETGLTLRYASRMGRDDIPAYVDLDLRVAWTLQRNLTLELVGQNLLDARRQEFPRETLFSVYPAEVERGGYLKLTCLW